MTGHGTSTEVRRNRFIHERHGPDLTGRLRRELKCDSHSSVNEGWLLGRLKRSQASLPDSTPSSWFPKPRSKGRPHLMAADALEHAGGVAWRAEYRAPGSAEPRLRASAAQHGPTRAATRTRAGCVSP